MILTDTNLTIPTGMVSMVPGNTRQRTYLVIHIHPKNREKQPNLTTEMQLQREYQPGKALSQPKRACWGLFQTRNRFLVVLWALLELFIQQMCHEGQVFLLSIGLFVIDYPKLDLRDVCKSVGIVAVKILILVFV